MLNVGIALGRGKGMSKLIAWSVAALAWLLAGTVVHAGERHYYYTDPQGTVLAETDVAGNIIETSEYRPYGARTLGTASSTPGYAGHVNDTDSGLVYMQARYYDAERGSFLSIDPISPQPGNVYSFGRYLYAINNPVKYIDPDGRLVGIQSDPRGDYYIDHLGRRHECNFCLDKKTASQKLARNTKWFLRSFKVQLGARLGLNAKIKVGKIGRLEIGTGYIGEGGELSGYMDFAYLLQGKGPSLALQLGRLKFGGEAGGWETRERMSLNGVSIEGTHTDPFLFFGIESKRDFVVSQGTISAEINPLILHAEISVNVSSAAVSLFYWGDSDLDPSE